MAPANALKAPDLGQGQPLQDGAAQSTLSAGIGPVRAAFGISPGNRASTSPVGIERIGTPVSPTIDRAVALKRVCLLSLRALRYSRAAHGPSGVA